jgi:dihydroorotate dehydrogenase
MQYNQVLNAVANVNGASFVTISTVTTPKLSGGKSNPHQGRVQKFMTAANVMVFQNKNANGYENMVQRRLKAEGKNPDSFVLGTRAWGTRLENLPIVEHTKDGEVKHYLEVIFLKAGASHYTLDGNIVPASSIQGLADPTEGEQGGLSDKVVIRTFDIENITEIRADGKIFN